MPQGFPEVAFATLSAVIVFSVLTLVVLATLEDAKKAWRGTSRGDRWRLFCYYQTARYLGVPYALDRYGVKPVEK